MNETTIAEVDADSISIPSAIVLPTGELSAPADALRHAAMQEAAEAVALGMDQVEVTVENWANFLSDERVDELLADIAAAEAESDASTDDELAAVIAEAAAEFEAQARTEDEAVIEAETATEIAAEAAQDAAAEAETPVEKPAKVKPVAPENRCRKCSEVIPPTGKPGRPPHYHPSCKDELAAEAKAEKDAAKAQRKAERTAAKAQAAAEAAAKAAEAAQVEAETSES
jgi:hypothetical protein